MNATLAIRELFEARGSSIYGGEAVTQLEHALQAVELAERAKSTPDLITAALLHDVGHLLHDLPDDAPDAGVDDAHESLGAKWAARWFGPAVVRPLQMHVQAKRYLCATNEEYFARLSPPSRQSLSLQGGPMSEEEVLEFVDDPYFRDAIRLRYWDEAAKIPGHPTPPLEHYLQVAAKVVTGANAT
jgi:[1-hydroxy-2-(trimethylamino)ethyl]phosphonate dioxygenase